MIAAYRTEDADHVFCMLLSRNPLDKNADSTESLFTSGEVSHTLSLPHFGSDSTRPGVQTPQDEGKGTQFNDSVSVSYTHLTLPTILRV